MTKETGLDLNIKDSLVSNGLDKTLGKLKSASKVASMVGIGASLVSPVACYAEQSISNQVDIIQKTVDVAPQVINGKTMLPVRALVESLGGSIEMASDGKSITIAKDGQAYTINRDIKTNSFIYKGIALAAMIKDGRTLMGVRDIGEKVLGLRIDWDEKNKVAYCLDLKSKQCVGMKIGSKIVNIYQDGNYAYHQVLVVMASRYKQERDVIFDALVNGQGVETFTVDTFRDERTGATVKLSDAITEKYNTPELMQAWFDANFRNRQFNSKQVVEVRGLKDSYDGTLSILRDTTFDLETKSTYINGVLVDKTKEQASIKAMSELLLKAYNATNVWIDPVTKKEVKGNPFYINKADIDYYSTTGMCRNFEMIKDLEGRDTIVLIDNAVIKFDDYKELTKDTVYFIYKIDPVTANKLFSPNRVFAPEMCYPGFMKKLGFAATWQRDPPSVVLTDESYLGIDFMASLGRIIAEDYVLTPEYAKLTDYETGVKKNMDMMSEANEWYKNGKISEIQHTIICAYAQGNIDNYNRRYNQ